MISPDPASTSTPSNVFHFNPGFTSNTPKRFLFPKSVLEYLNFLVAANVGDKIHLLKLSPQCPGCFWLVSHLHGCAFPGFLSLPLLSFPFKHQSIIGLILGHLLYLCFLLGELMWPPALSTMCSWFLHLSLGLQTLHWVPGSCFQLHRRQIHWDNKWMHWGNMTDLEP